MIVSKTHADRQFLFNGSKNYLQAALLSKYSAIFRKCP